MEMKICGDCGLEKSADEYYKDRATKDGLRRRCKACVRVYLADNKEHIAARMKIYQADHKEHIADYQKTYSQSPKGKITRNIGRKKYCQNHPEKKSAKNAVYLAIKNGIIRRSVFCEGCGLPAITQAHHEDYNKPLKVDWLCNDCHTTIRVL